MESMAIPVVEFQTWDTRLMYNVHAPLYILNPLFEGQKRFFQGGFFKKILPL